MTSLAEKPVFDPDTPTRREKVGLLGPEEVAELNKLTSLLELR